VNGPLPSDVERNNDLVMSELIDAHVRYLRASRQSPDTIASRIRLLRALHAELPFGLAFASTDELNDYLQSNPSWSAWTQCTYAMHIRGFYSWANGRHLDGDPSAEMARPRTPDFMPNPVTEEELQIALERSPEPWRTGIMLAAYAGLRVSEIGGLYREHVTESSIRIVRAKGGSPAAIDTHPLIWEMVQDRPAGPLAVRPNGEAVDGRWFSTNSKYHFRKIGLPGVHMHRFRHRFGTALLESGVDIRTVQEALRHKSITSTQGYTLVRGGQRRLAIRSLPTPGAQPPEEN
jgi:integrase/recombinase XerD